MSEIKQCEVPQASDHIRRDDHLSALAQARAEERERLADEAIEAQLSVSVFATSKECIAYNRALREFADRIRTLDERTDEGER